MLNDPYSRTFFVLFSFLFHLFPSFSSASFYSSSSFLSLSLSDFYFFYFFIFLFFWYDGSLADLLLEL